VATITFSHNHIILDACCVINLYASKKMAQILTTIPKPVYISSYVNTKEVLRVYNTASNQVERVDLNSLLDQNSLTIVDLNLETEAEHYVNLAMAMDDGEAVTGAIALARNWAIASDDKAAIKVFQREAPQLQIITTPELIKYWADNTAPSPETVAECLQNIIIGAKFRPSKRHHLYDWWHSYAAD
jgi:hypothetical protein